MMTIKVVVPLSGGKDSQMCLVLALLLYDKSEVMGLFCDTKFEHPKTYAHIETMRKLYGVSIITINAGSVVERVLRWGRFPGGGSRHCTDDLKIKPSKKFYKKFAEEQGGFEVWYGMRSGESGQRKVRYSSKEAFEAYAPHEVLPKKYPKYLFKKGVVFRLPILDTTSDEVLRFLNGEENPLYSDGFDRVGCFPCLMSGDKWKEKAFAYDDFGNNQRVISIKLASDIGKPLWNSKGGNLRNPDQSFEGCAICAI
jgi:3'-phosphoadenosine 5'-phosphosulfate sulfotransferase (PAPS reductase)/FAD synthetase